MDRESTTPTKTPFHAGILSVHSDSATIGPVHRRVLREKKDDFQCLLQEKVRQLQDDAQKYLHSQLSHQRQQQQQQQGVLTEETERSSPAISRTSLDSVSLHSESPPPLLEDPEVTTARFQQQQEAVDQLRDMYQARLDQLYVRFQKEWLKNPRETKPIKLPLPCSPDCQYVADCLGRALPQALAEICDKRPKDPIEYLAHWLRKHAENTQQLQQQDVDDMKLKLEGEEQVMLRDRRQRLKAEIGHLKDENDRRKAIYLQRSRAAETSKPARQPYSVPEEKEEEKTVSERQSPQDEVEDNPRNTDRNESAQDNGVPTESNVVTTGSDVVATGSDVGDVGKAYMQGNTASAATALYTIQEHD